MNDQRPRDGYTQTRSTMRMLGPILIGIGAVLFLIAMISMIGAVSVVGSGAHRVGFPPGFFLSIPGVLLLGLGLFFTKAGYLREIMQYAAKETTPAVTTTTTAIRAAIADDDIPCPGCSRPIEPNAKFCSHCGIRLAGITCPVCQATLEAGDRFCSSCGHDISGSIAS